MHTRWQTQRFAPFGLIHWWTTSREAWITQTVFAQLPDGYTHSNFGIYYTVLLKECWHKQTEAKSWSLCNALCSDTRVIRAAWLVCACEHTVCGGCGMRCLIRALSRSIRHASYNNQAEFWSDKSEPPPQVPSIPPRMPPSSACSQTFLSVIEPWPDEHRRKAKEGQLTQVLNRLVRLLSRVLNLYLTT